MHQFWEIKQNHYDTVLFFQKGKFYELYEDDAATGANEFGLKLTDRVKMKMASALTSLLGRQNASLTLDPGVIRSESPRRASRCGACMHPWLSDGSKTLIISSPVRILSGPPSSSLQAIRSARLSKPKRRSGQPPLASVSSP